MKAREVPVSELVEDFDLYPRHDVNSQNVGNMVEALAAGEDLPPVVACETTKRIVDGFHRCRAYKRHGGDNALIPVIFKTYKNDAELFLDAMQRNSGHGYQLDTDDKVRCAIKAAALRIEPAVVAAALRVTSAWLDGKLETRTAIGPVMGNREHRQQIAIKRTIEHMAGKKLTKNQLAANEKLSGMRPLFYCNQLILLLENGLMPTDNEKLTEGLRKLAALLEQTVAVSS